MPEPPVSPVLDVSVTVPRRFAPGSASVAVGAIASTLATDADVNVLVLPTLSVTR
jgi:hypothetical protein